METTYPEKCERYIQNLRRVRALSKPQFAPETAPEALLEEIQDNAVSSFGLMQENNALLNELVYVLDPKTLTDEEITNLEAFAGRLFNFGNSEDCGVAYKIHSLLLEAARFREDDRMIVKELYYNGITLHYLNVRDDDHGINLLESRIHAHFMEAASYISRYEEMDTETRQYIIRSLGNIRLTVSRQTKADCKRYLELFDLAMGIIESPYYQELDPDIPWQRFIYAMHMDQMTLMAYLRHHDDPVVAERVLKSATYVYEHQKANRGDESRLQNWRANYFYHAARYHAGKGTARAVVEDLLDMIDQTGARDYSPDGINRNLTGAAYIFYYETLMTEQERTELADRIAKEREAAHRYLDEMPSNEYPRVASFAIRELIIAQSDAKQFDAHTVLGSILLGHKPTEVHSTMVAHLTKALIRRLIDTDPAAVVGLKGCKNVAEVAARKAELLDTAYECGLYHDVGKSAVIQNIDNNGRRLIDEEFQGIQTHPAIGCGLLQEAGCGKYMAPAALYHHRFYNGQGGYPKDVPPCPPEIKVIVDALSVADSLLPDGQAFPHAGRGAESPERHPLRSQSGGPVRRQGFLRRAGAEVGREAQGGLFAGLPHRQRKINRKTFHFLCRYDTISSKSAQEERHAQRGKRWKRCETYCYMAASSRMFTGTAGTNSGRRTGRSWCFSFPSRSFFY